MIGTITSTIILNIYCKNREFDESKLIKGIKGINFIFNFCKYECV